MMCVLQHKSPVKSAVWSKDGKYFATVSSLGSRISLENCYISLILRYLGTVQIYDSDQFDKRETAEPFAVFRDQNERNISEVLISQNFQNHYR